MTTLRKLSDMREAYAFEHAPMTYSQSDIFVKSIFLDSLEKGPFDQNDAMMLGTAGQVLWKRMNVWLGPKRAFPISKGLAAVICGFSKTPGHVVMWTFTLHRMYKEVHRMLTVDDFADVFPMGLPTSSATDRLWISQKGHTDDGIEYNRVDDIREWDAS